MSDPIGTTKPVWHVLGPGGKHRPASRMKRCQRSEGVATLSDAGGGSIFWAVKRPEWRDTP